MYKTGFTFVTLTFNHENYILEHLESIKFQVTNYGFDYSVDLIISDDCSKDETVDLIKKWCHHNSAFFNDIKIIENLKNLGTCHNFTNTWNYISNNYYKISAGDDLFSNENIFKWSKETNKHDIISFMPLYLIDKKIKYNYLTILGIISSNTIYKSFSDRIRSLNVINAPSLFYTNKILNNKIIFDFIHEFQLTEDLPLQLKMAEQFKSLNFSQKNNVIVYYRRTSNSTYIIKNKNFNEDKVKIYKYLIKTEQNIFRRLLIKNRLFCFNLNNRFLKIVLNLNYYKYGFSCIFSARKIYSEFKTINIELERHQFHYDLIRNNVIQFNKEIGSN